MLSRLRDWNDQESGRQFFNAYWKLVYSVARQAGLSESEAQEARNPKHKESETAPVSALPSNIKQREPGHYELKHLRCALRSRLAGWPAGQMSNLKI